MKNTLWKSILSVLLCAALLFGCIGALAQQPIPPQVTSVMSGPNGAKLRSKPTVSGDNVVANLSPYTEMDVVGYEEGWYKVRLDDKRGYVHEGVVFIAGYTETPRSYTGADVPQSYLDEQAMWAQLIDLHGDTFLVNGNNDEAFSRRNVELMDGEYWRYGGMAVEKVGYVSNKGANLRRNMDRNDTKGVLIYNVPRRTPVNVLCYFYDASGSVWFYVECANMEGYMHSQNVDVDLGFEFEEEEDDW